MEKTQTTRERLLSEARRLIWSRGYSNVSLREITRGAGVDVALVSRYFGGKRGLFEATLDEAFDPPKLQSSDKAQLVDDIVDLFLTAPRDKSHPSFVQMILMNAGDEEVGPLVRAQQRDKMQAQLEDIIGDKGTAALFMAVLLGIIVAEKSLFLPGIAPLDSPQYEAQLRHVMNAALTYRS